MTTTFAKALHSGNWQKSSPSCKISRKCANADTTGTLYLHMEVALRMEVNMHDACTGLVQASFMHCQPFGAHWHRQDRTLLNISHVMMKYCTKLPVWRITINMDNFVHVMKFRIMHFQREYGCWFQAETAPIPTTTGLTTATFTCIANLTTLNSLFLLLRFSSLPPLPCAWQLPPDHCLDPAAKITARSHGWTPNLLGLTEL